MATMFLKQAFAATVLALAASAPQAAVLYSQAPVAGINGIQADGGTGPYPQSFTVAPGSTLESIEWFGYHGVNSGGPMEDLFTVLVNGVDVVPLGLSIFDADPLDGVDLYQYRLFIQALPVVSGTFELANGPDTEWFWQYSNVDLQTTAFTLNGTPGAIPEPQTAALILLGLAAMVGVRRRNRRA